MNKLKFFGTAEDILNKADSNIPEREDAERYWEFLIKYLRTYFSENFIEKQGEHKVFLVGGDVELEKSTSYEEFFSFFEENKEKEIIDLLFFEENKILCLEQIDVNIIHLFLQQEVRFISPEPFDINLMKLKNPQKRERKIEIKRVTVS